MEFGLKIQGFGAKGLARWALYAGLSLHLGCMAEDVGFYGAGVWIHSNYYANPRRGLEFKQPIIQYISYLHSRQYPKTRGSNHGPLIIPNMGAYLFPAS